MDNVVRNMTAVIIATGTMTISIFDTTNLFLIDIFLSTDILLFEKVFHRRKRGISRHLRSKISSVMILKNGFRYVFVFLLGAVIYNLVEVIFRGYTHWSMSVAGGSVLLIFYLLSDWLAALHPVIGGMIGALVITCIELIAGVIFNILLRQDVWDYSNMPLNFLGQICLPFSAVWFILYFPAEYLCLALKRKFEPKERNQFEAM